MDLTQLRAATSAADLEAVRATLSGHQLDALLQHAGNALLAVGPALLPELAEQLRRLLHEREQPGDPELADALWSRTGGPVPALRPLYVDLELVAVAMSGDRGGHLDLTTGEAWPRLDDLNVLDDDEEDDHDDRDRWLPLAGEGSRPAWRDRLRFAEALPGGPFRTRLLEALDGRGAFRRFARVLEDDDELLQDWLTYRAECELGRARALLADEGYLALPLTR